MKNKGIVAVETALVLPLFLIAMLSFYSMLQSRFAELVVYEAAVETAEYLAEFSYLECGSSLVAQAKFGEYVDDEALLERYVQGGIDGVNFRGSVMLTEENQVLLKVNYKVKAFLPYNLGFSGDRSFTIRRNAYVGDKKGEDDEAKEGEEYVFVTENQEVYHSTRSCTYLRLDKSVSTVEHAKGLGYSACEYCGRDAGDSVIITGYGRRYHSRENCVGLKRTVRRVKKSSVENLPPCSRCN